MEIRRALTIFCNQGPKVRERIHLLQLLILNEYAARCAVARHYLGLVDVFIYAHDSRTIITRPGASLKITMLQIW